MTGPADASEEQSMQGEQLRTRYLDTADRRHLDEAVRLGRLALAAATDDTARGVRSFRLGTTLSVLTEATGDVRFLDEAAALQAVATRLLPADHEDRPAAWTNTGILALHRFQRSGRLTDLDAAITHLRRGLDSYPPGDPRVAGAHSNLGGALRTRYQMSDDPHDLDEAIQHARAAVGTGRSEHRAMMTASLAGSLALRARRTADLSDLDEAISRAEEARQAAAAGTGARAAALSILATAYQQHTEVTGALDSLSRAIEYQRETIGILPDAHPEAVIHYDGLATSLRLRFERLGVAHDLAQAIAAGQRACDVAQIDLTSRQAAASQAMLLRLQAATRESAGDTRGALASCAEALTLASRAVTLTPAPQWERPDALTVLGNIQMASYELSRDDAAARAAISSYRAALHACAPGDPRRARILSNLGHAQVEAVAAASEGDLEPAIAVLRLAADAAAAQTPAWGQIAGNLASALARRYSRQKNEADRQEALELCRAVSAWPAAPPDKTVLLSSLGAELSMSAGDAAGAAAFYQSAIQLLPAVAWLGLDRTTQEARLESASDLTRDGAACLMAAGDGSGALMSLEQGRGVLWSQLLQLRQDRAELEQAHPELAARLQQLTNALAVSPE